MDDLDRLYERLASNIREGFPHLTDRAFQLGDIGEHLVPYRLNRRELGFDSVRQFEVALMRLAAGERGYVRADPAVQEAFRRALASPEPDASLLRDQARASVALSGGRGAAVEAAHASAVEAVRPPVEPMPVASPTTFVEPPVIQAPVEAAPDMFGITPATFGVPTPMWTDTAAPVEETARPEDVSAPAFESAPPRSKRVDLPVEPRVGPTVVGGPCRYCAQPLPDGRAVTFCPHCGQNVTVEQCPACSTELEVGWHFCITCGRAMDEAALSSGAS